eukprot:6209547-Pleurochrysis_carterae.AAC.1
MENAALVRALPIAEFHPEQSAPCVRARTVHAYCIARTNYKFMQRRREEIVYRSLRGGRVMSAVTIIYDGWGMYSSMRGTTQFG